MSDNRTTKDLYSISNILTPFAKKILGKRGFIEVDIITNWDKIVGNELAKTTIPQQIDFKKNQRSNGTLHIQTISGAFALELKHKEKNVIEKINTYFGYNAVSNLKIIQNSALFETFFDDKPLQNSKKNLVTKEEENYINEMTQDLENPKLKEILTKLGHNILGSSKKEETN